MILKIKEKVTLQNEVLLGHSFILAITTKKERFADNERELYKKLEAV